MKFWIRYSTGKVVALLEIKMSINNCSQLLCGECICGGTSNNAHIKYIVYGVCVRVLAMSDGL